MTARCAPLLLALAACSSEPPADVRRPVEPGDPGAPGPYPVGVSTFTLAEIGPYTDVPVEVWYPAAAPGGVTTTYDFLGVQFPSVGGRDVAPSTEAPSLLVAFSHGLGGVRQQNYAMAERLASHGFVVVAPDHPGTTTLDFLASFGDLGPSLLVRTATVQAAVDAVQGGVVPGLAPPGDRYAMVGHSLGAFTAMALGGGVLALDRYTAACAAEAPPVVCDLLGPLTFDADEVATWIRPDPRIAVTVLQQPGGWYAFDDASLATLPRPLVFASTEDTILPADGEALQVWARLGSPSALATFEGAGHYAPSNMCDLSVATVFAPDCAGEAGGFVDPVVVREASNRYVTAWLGVTFGEQPAFQADLVASDGVSWTTR